MLQSLKVMMLSLFLDKIWQFPLKRFFVVEGDKINTKVKWSYYGLDTLWIRILKLIIGKLYPWTHLLRSLQGQTKKFKASISKMVSIPKS